MAVNITQGLLTNLIQRNLGRAAHRAEQSFERLSSGKRINRAADDPAGLAASDQFRYEIQSLRKLQQNVSGAFSIIGAAESQLDAITESLQRARELAVQAGSDTLSPANRQAIRDELNQILAEIDRLATGTTINEFILLDGSFTNVRVQTGATAAESMTISLGDMRTGALGAWAQAASTGGVAGLPITADHLFINGVAIDPSTGDSVSSSLASASAIAKAAAINAAEARTGVRAEALPTRWSGLAAIAPVNLNETTNTLRINGIAIPPVDVAPGDGALGLVNLINARSAQTGVEAALGPAGELQLTAADGRNIQLEATGAVGQALGLSATPGNVTRTITGDIRLISNKAFNLNDPDGCLGIVPGVREVAVDNGLALAGVDLGSVAGSGDALRSLDAALAQVGAERSRLGAMHNRLETLTGSLARRVEDLSGADSAIRDTDFAFETARLTQAQILQEASLSLLAQANISPRRALELLQR